MQKPRGILNWLYKWNKCRGITCSTVPGLQQANSPATLCATPSFYEFFLRKYMSHVMSTIVNVYQHPKLTPTTLSTTTRAPGTCTRPSAHSCWQPLRPVGPPKRAPWHIISLIVTGLQTTNMTQVTSESQHKHRKTQYINWVASDIDLSSCKICSMRKRSWKKGENTLPTTAFCSVCYLYTVSPCRTLTVYIRLYMILLCFYSHTN